MYMRSCSERGYNGGIERCMYENAKLKVGKSVNSTMDQMLDLDDATVDAIAGLSSA